MENHIEQISRICSLYLQALKDGQSDSSIFYDRAQIFSVQRGRLCGGDLSSYIRSASSLSSSHIRYINTVNPTMAYACICLQTEDGQELHLLGCVKDGELWKIVVCLRSLQDQPFENWFTPAEVQEQEFSKICRAISTYVEGIYTLRSQLSLSVFSPDARMLSTDAQGHLADFPCSVFEERWQGLIPASQSGLSKYCRIENLHMLGPSLALAQVWDAKRLDFFYDYLSLARIEGKWTVIHKITCMPVTYAG